MPNTSKKITKKTTASKVQPIDFEYDVSSLLKRSGQEYFDFLVKFLCKKTNSKFAFVGKYNEEAHTVSTSAFLANGNYVKEFVYDLENTPCSTVIDNELCIYPESVQLLFPKDEDLVTFGIESYIGMPLFGLEGEALGIVVIMNDEPIVHVEEVKTILNLVESKTELELEKLFLKGKIALSKKDFHDIFENFQDIFFSINYDQNDEPIDGTVSPSVETILGYTPDEYHQLKHEDLYNNISERKVYIQLIKAEKQVKNYPLTLKKKDGSLVYVQIDSELIEGVEHQGVAYSLRGVIKDVTKQYKENLRIEMAYLIAEKSQRRLTNIKSLAEFIHSVLDHVVDVSNFYIALHDTDKNELYMPVFIDEHKDVLDDEFRIPYANGLTEYIIKSKNVLEKDKRGLQELIDEKGLSLRGKLSEYYVGVPLKSEGQCFGVMVMQSYKKNYHFSKEDIELLKFISTQVSYVIERTQWQETLIEKEEHYRSLVENSSEIIGSIDMDGIITYISESAYRIIGFKPVELIGKNIGDFINADNLDEVIKDRISNPSQDRLEVLKVMHKKGKKKYVEISLNSNKNKKDELIFNAKDITARVVSDRKIEFAQKRLSTLHQIERALLSNKPLEKILNDALKVITDNIFDVDRASVGLLNYEEERSEIIALRTKYKTNKGIKAGEFIPFEQLTSIHNVLKNKPFYVSDVSKLVNPKNSDEKNKSDGIQSYYIRPIVINKKVIGTFNFGSQSKDYFKNIDEDLLEEITQLVAVVIHDAILKRELADRERDLTTIFDSSSEGILKTGKDNRFLFVNKRICDILGYSEEEMLSKSILEITFQDDIEVTKEILNSLQVDKPKEYAVNKRLVHKNGTLINCRISAIPFYNKDGVFDHSVAFVYDETEMVQAKKQVIDLRNALDHSSAVFFTDEKGVIQDLNTKLEALSGYSRKEIIGQTPRLFNSDYHSKAEWKVFWETIKSGKTFTGELRNRKKDGSIYWVFVTVTPLLDNKGKIDQYIAVQIDVTEEKRAKTNLIREVIEAQEHERERFAMEIHDGLGQVLLATKMNLSAVNDSSEGLDEESRKILSNSLDLLTEAVQEARNISHGLMSRVLSKFGLAYAVGEIINNINATTNLDFSLEHNIEGIRFDEEIEMGVYRTLQELVKNIIKHSRATKADLTIKKNDKELFIEIRDNGIGIEKGTINNPKSGGIGLRNMRSRIEYLGGAFEIDNKIKKGTNIKINISL